MVDRMSASSDREKLKRILQRHSIKRGSFVLASGERSSVYVDCRLTTLRGEAMPLVGRLVLQRIRARGWNPEAVGGLTMGADPVACAVARESQETPDPVNAFVVRKEEKEHGRKRQVEGLSSTEGVRCVVLDDVCTTGGSTVRAIHRARAAGMEVLGACCMVDREQGAAAALEAVGCSLEALFTMNELLAD